MAKKKGRGRPPLPDFTPDELNRIEGLAKNGVRQDRIAALMGCSETHLKKKCAPILERGAKIYEARLEENVATLALSGDKDFKSIMIFMAKVRLGYREDFGDPGRESEKRSSTFRYRVTAQGERIAKSSSEDDDDE